ncbi:MAG: ArnT family glycosyltransferase [Gemmatimonadales bacterium]
MSTPAPDRAAAAPEARPFAGREGAVLALVWTAAAALGYAYLRRGWIPHDVGTLGHAAERVLAGELPHRDFADVYTGGQAMLNALAFRLLGTELMSLRSVFFAAYLLWVPCVWYVARSFAGPTLAAVTTLLAASITLPVYPEGMPSWYNLFLATAGTASLVRYLRGGGRVWLVLAGVAGGVSILFKIVGLYYVAGALLFLLHLETREPSERSTDSDAAYRVVMAVACMVLAFAALYVVVSGSGPVGLLHFAVPPLVAVVAVSLRLTRESGRTSAARFRALARTVGPFKLGVAVPVGLFLIPYVASGALGALYEGVFVLPRARLEFPAEGELPVLGFAPAAALALWAASRNRMVTLLGGGALLALVAASQIDMAYRLTWWTLISIGPVLAVAVAWWPVAADQPTRQRDSAVLLLAVFGFANLVQIPYSAPIYFLYAAPLLVLLALPLAHEPAAARRLLFVVSLLLGFAVLRLDTGFIRHLGYRYRPHEETEALEIPRARGIRVAAEEKLEAEQLVEALGRIGAGPVILALPDAPEVYFLSGLTNPSPTLFDFYEDPEKRTERVLALVDGQGIGTVVLNRRRLFAPLVEGPLLDSLEARLDWSAEIGRFRVLWKGPANVAVRTP